MSDYELVRVSRKLVEMLTEDDSAPVVVVRIEPQDDGTCEMVFKHPEITDAMVERAWRAFDQRAAGGADALRDESWFEPAIHKAVEAAIAPVVIPSSQLGPGQGA